MPLVVRTENAGPEIGADDNVDLGSFSAIERAADRRAVIAIVAVIVVIVGTIEIVWETILVVLMVMKTRVATSTSTVLEGQGQN